MVFLLIVLGCFGLADGVLGKVGNNASASFAVSTCTESMHLCCGSDEHIFIMNMLYGFKPANITLSTSPTCQPEGNDCFEDYTEVHFNQVYSGCWNNINCLAQPHFGSSVCLGQSAMSTFSVADYTCLKAKNIIGFYVNSSLTASAVAIHYYPSNIHYYSVIKGENQTWHCLVDTVTYTQIKADVIMVKENYVSYLSQRCTTVGWSGGHSLPCVTDFQYTRFSTSTPFWVGVMVDRKHIFPSGWAVVRAKGVEELRVTCGLLQVPTVGPETSKGSKGTSAAHTTVTSAPIVSSTPHRPKKASPLITRNLPFSSSLSISSAVSTPGTFAHATQGSERTKGGSSVKNTGTSPNTGILVGGVVAAVVGLFGAGLAVFCYVRRCRGKLDSVSKSTHSQKSSAHMALTSMDSTSLSRHLASDSRTEGSSSQDYSEVGNPVYSVPLKTDKNKVAKAAKDNIVYDKPGRGYKSQNSHAATPGYHGKPNPVEDPDYDRLGGKKSQISSSNPAATYGRLERWGEGGEDTDYSYDHLARGRQADPDVIDSDYDTARLHMTSEGDYSVADFHKRKQQVITRSDYDVAEVVTSVHDVTDDPSTHIRVGGAMYAVAKPIMTSSGDADYDEARTMTEPVEESEYSRVRK